MSESFKSIAGSPALSLLKASAQEYLSHSSPKSCDPPKLLLTAGGTIFHNSNVSIFNDDAEENTQKQDASSYHPSRRFASFLVPVLSFIKAFNGRNPKDSCGNIGESCFEEISEKKSAMETAELLPISGPLFKKEGYRDSGSKDVSFGRENQINV
jgi:hypothetical protein